MAIGITLAVAVVAASGAPRGSASGEPSLEYLAQLYLSGSRDAAVAVAARRSPDRLTAEAERLIDRKKSPGEAEQREALLLPAAAILAEVSLSRLSAGDGPLAPGLQAAARLLRPEALDERGRLFARRLFLTGGLTLHAHIELEEAYQFLREGSERFPEDPELLTALGAVIEAVASLRRYDPAPGSGDAARRTSGGYKAEAGERGGSIRDADVLRAEGLYGRALALEPGLLEARLRLARVLLLQEKPGQALALLERAAAEARRERDRYLARLFEGRAREKLGDLAGAEAAFRAAVESGLPAQTALLALGRALERAGDRAGAQVTFARLGAPGAPYDPWWSYGLGQPDRLELLIGELRDLTR